MKKLDNSGNVAIILCLLVAAIFGFAAYVIDIGLVYVEKTKLSNAIDSASLAAVLELPSNDINARAVALDYLQKNNVDASQVVITIATDHKSIQIKGMKNVNHLFAPIIGINSSVVNAETKAIVAPAKSVKGGIRPFAVVMYNYNYGDLVTLKEEAGDGYKGNYKTVALGGTGSNVLDKNAIYGYSGTISVGDYIPTETGNKASVANDVKKYINSEYSTFNNFSRNSIRLWTIPLIDSLNVNGRETVLVVGFGQFYVEEVVGNAGKIEITGRFVKYVTNATVDMNLNDTGVYGAKLAK